MISVVCSVSDSRDPGGSSIARSERAVSCAGRNPRGSSPMLQIDAANSTTPMAMVATLWRTDQLTSAV